MSTFSKQDWDVFKRILRHVGEQFKEGETRPWPDGETADLVQGITVTPAPEVIMFDSETFGTALQAGRVRYLLRHRDPENDPGPWNGWHIPGGYMSPGMSFREKVYGICKEDANLEKKDIVSIFGIVRASDWTRSGKALHPYGYPFSLTTVVSVNAEAVETHEKLKWFQVSDRIPPGMIDTSGQHEEYLESFFDWLRGGARELLPIPR